MVDQSIGFLEGIAKDVMVRIHDQFAPTDFMVLDVGEEDDDITIILGCCRKEVCGYAKVIHKKRKMRKMDKCPRYLKQWILRCPPRKKKKKKS